MMAVQTETRPVAALQVWCVGEEQTPRASAEHPLIAAGCALRSLSTRDLLASLSVSAAPDVVVVLVDDEVQSWRWLEALEADPVGRDLPVVAVNLGSEGKRTELLRRGIAYCLQAPFEADELTLVVRRAAQSRRNRATVTGSLTQLAAADLLQTAEVARRSGVIVLRRGRSSARLLLSEGRLLDAIGGDGRRGAEVVHEVALWEDGTFEADFRPIEITEVTVHDSLSSLLLDAARRTDELGRDAALRPHAVLPDPPPLPPPHRLAGHRALTLVAIACGWACDLLLPELVRERFETARLELLAQWPMLDRFELVAGARVRWVGEFPIEGETEALAAAVGTWVRRTFATLERARPGRFDTATLAALTEAIGEDLNTLGFDTALGITREHTS